jgi:hypothetical protein
MMATEKKLIIVIIIALIITIQVRICGGLHGLAPEPTRGSGPLAWPPYCDQGAGPFHKNAVWIDIAA